MDVLGTLRTEENRLKNDLARIQKAIAALDGLGGNTTTSSKRKLSAAGRASREGEMGEGPSREEGI